MPWFSQWCIGLGINELFGLNPSSVFSTTQCFGNWVCSSPQVKGCESPTLLDPSDRANLNNWTSVRSNRAGSHHSIWEKKQINFPEYVLYDTRPWVKSKNSVILSLGFSFQSLKRVCKISLLIVISLQDTDCGELYTHINSAYFTMRNFRIYSGTPIYVSFWGSGSEH
jgi:hypothetical protein